MITVKDVASKAGVSLGTVSRVLNKQPDVTQENVQKVEAAIRVLGYQVKNVKRRAELTARNIGLLFLGADRSLVTLPVIAQATHGIQAALNAAGASTLIADLPKLDRLPPFLERDEVDGVLLKGPLQGSLPPPGSNLLCDRLRSLPSVWVMGRPHAQGSMWGDHCGPDNLAVGRLAAERLVLRGHRVLGYLNVRPGQVAFEERQMSFEWHARKRGAMVHVFSAPAPSEFQLPLQAAGDAAAMEVLLDRLCQLQPRPTGVFVPSDNTAILLYHACAKRRIKIGEDLAVISSNHEQATIAGLFPTLTTVDVRAEDIGARTVDLLLWRLTNPVRPPADLTIQPVLVEGQSG